MGVYGVIKSDLQRLSGDTSFRSFIRWYIMPQGSTFPHDVWLRILQECKNRKWKKYTIGLIAYIIERHFSFKYGIHVNSNIKIGKGLKIVHCDGIYINCKSIGDNFTIYQNVTLGTAGEGVPIIEDNVTIYPGAVVVGKIVLQSGCIIGANSYVDKDVPKNAFVAGIPAKIIKINDSSRK